MQFIDYILYGVYAYPSASLAYSPHHHICDVLLLHDILYDCT